MKKYSELILNSQKDEFIQLCNNPNDFVNEADSLNFRLDVTDKDKGFRGALHMDIRKYMKGFYSETKDVEDKKIITIKYLGKEDVGKYLKFVLRKRNWDTMQAVNQIAKCVKKNTGNFFFAGNKDKRGETVQWITAKNVAKKEMAGFINMKYWKWEEISFSNLEYVDEPIKLGELMGNRFTVVLRCKENAENNVINNNVENVKANGFINYFGLQRFGTKSKVI